MGSFLWGFYINFTGECGRPARTLRTFCDDRAAPVAPALYFLCAKQMRPIIWWPAFGAPLLIRIALPSSPTQARFQLKFCCVIGMVYSVDFTKFGDVFPSFICMCLLAGL